MKTDSPPPEYEKIDLGSSPEAPETNTTGTMQVDLKTSDVSPGSLYPPLKQQENQAWDAELDMMTLVRYCFYIGTC